MVDIYCDSPQELFDTAADLIAAHAARVLDSHDFVTFTLAGGSTPKGLYARLAATGALPWERVHLLWGDERVVPPDSIDSNYRMTKESLLSAIEIPDGNVHRVQTELGAEQAASDYEATIRSLCAGHSPMLDIVLLGVGPDGHTASLFPGQPQTAETERLVTATPEASREPRVRRVSMTFRLLNDASLVIFLVSGEEKTPVVRSIVTKDAAASSYPAARVDPKGRLVWAVYPPSGRA